MPCLMAAARAPAMAAQQQQPSLCARGSSGAAASSSSLRASMISPISPRRFQRRSAASLSVVAASTADRTFFVGGNWKSNCTKSSVKTLVKELNDAAKGQLGGLPPADQVEIVVGPEHIHLSMVLDSIDSRYGVSAQNCWTTSGGAYTGEVRGGVERATERESGRRGLGRKKKKVAKNSSSSSSPTRDGDVVSFSVFSLRNWPAHSPWRPAQLFQHVEIRRRCTEGGRENERARLFYECALVEEEGRKTKQSKRRFQIERGSTRRCFCCSRSALSLFSSLNARRCVLG